MRGFNSHKSFLHSVKPTNDPNPISTGPYVRCLVVLPTSHGMKLVTKNKETNQQEQ